MEYRVLGRTGVRVSPICLGTDNVADPTPEDEATRILNRVMDEGLNLLDTGDVYAGGEGEKIIGRALKANGRRHDMIIATKVDYGKRRAGVLARRSEHFWSERSRAHASEPDPRVRELIAATADRLHRPLSDPSLLSRYSSRRDPGVP